MSSIICSNGSESVNQCEDLNEYSSLLNNLNSLRNQLNKILLENNFIYRNSIEEWKYQCFKFLAKYSKLQSNKSEIKIKEDINYLINNIYLLIENLNRNSIDSIENVILFVKESLNQIKNIQNSIKPLEIDDSTIQIESSIENEKIFLNFQIATDSSSSKSLSIEQINCIDEDRYSYQICLSARTSYYPYLISPIKTLNLLSDYCSSMSNNENNILVISKSTIYLFNKDFKMLIKKSFNSSGIKDICWSKTLQKYLLLSPKQISSCDYKTMIIQPLKLPSYDQNLCWERLTSSEKCLVLSTYGENPLIFLFDLFPSIQLNKKYQFDCQSNINDIKCNENNHLSILMEQNLSNQTIFQLRSLENFQCIWNVTLGQGWNYRSSYFNNKYWIVSDQYNERIIFIDLNGKILKTEFYFLKPLNIISFNSYQILVRTNNAIHLHQSQ